jgi:hypothetical protein
MMKKQFELLQRGDQFEVVLYVRQTMGDKWEIAHSFGLFDSLEEAQLEQFSLANQE